MRSIGLPELIIIAIVVFVIIGMAVAAGVTSYILIRRSRSKT